MKIACLVVITAKKHHYFLINCISLIPEMKVKGGNAESARSAEKLSVHAKN